MSQFAKYKSAGMKETGRAGTERYRLALSGNHWMTNNSNKQQQMFGADGG